jgi:hypothetical protein
MKKQTAQEYPAPARDASTIGMLPGVIRKQHSDFLGVSVLRGEELLTFVRITSKNLQRTRFAANGFLIF